MWPAWPVLTWMMLYAAVKESGSSEIPATTCTSEAADASQLCHRLDNRSVSAQAGRGVILLQMHQGKEATKVRVPGTEVSVTGIISHKNGGCLQAVPPQSNGGAVEMWTCIDALEQQWSYDSTSGSITHSSGRCLYAPSPSSLNTFVGLWDCSPGTSSQQWSYNSGTGALKLWAGICLDTYEPAVNGGVVHLWPCDGDSPNQQWFIGDKVSGAAYASSTPTSSTTIAEVPLKAARNCYLDPLEEGNGCRLLSSIEDNLEFGLSSFGQETAGKQACLNRMRQSSGDTFVFTLGTCQIWLCGSKQVLYASATGGDAGMAAGVQPQSLESIPFPLEMGKRASQAFAQKGAHDMRSETMRKLSVAEISVFSQLCRYQEPFGGHLGNSTRAPVFVKLWEWNFADIAKECTEFLGPNRIDAVQVSPVQEHILGDAWWTKYQPVSGGFDSRSGSEADFADMVASCRKAGVQVIADVVLNHLASPCKEGAGSHAGTPCQGWAGGHWGNRRAEGRFHWDSAVPEQFHHYEDKLFKNCAVSEATAWLCDNKDSDCTACDMYGMPDWNTELQVVRDGHAKFLERLFHIGVTMLRVDGAIYMEVADLANFLNRFPWDFVFQEWWGEFPPSDRTEFVGHYRDVAYRSKVVQALAVNDISNFADLLNLGGGVSGISEEMAYYPIAFHDGRSAAADSTIATYKNGLEYHQQQKFFLAWPFGISTMIWSGYTWTNLDQGPPGCERGMSRCNATAVFENNGILNCLATPTISPLLENAFPERTWACEHRWQGVAGLVHFRKSCRGLPLSQIWVGGVNASVQVGQVAFQLGEVGSCFVALVRGYNEDSKPAWGHLGNWDLSGLQTGLPAGRFCDLSSLDTQLSLESNSCPREVVLGPGGVVESGIVPEGDILAIHTGAMLR